MIEIYHWHKHGKEVLIDIYLNKILLCSIWPEHKNDINEMHPMIKDAVHYNKKLYGVK